MNKANILKYTKEKVRKLFANFPIPAHGIEHVARVAAFAKKIAQSERVDVFITEMSGWLHDIGRTREKERSGTSSFHHEMSYEMCRDWFKHDQILQQLAQKEKEIILYSIRYHWNNAADKYPEAIILRDADKLDSLGKKGLERALEYWAGDEENLERAFRMVFGDISFIKTNTAKRMVKENKLLDLPKKYFLKLLKQKVKKINL